jgi:hypothetical protein
MKHKILVKTVVVSETGHTSVAQDVVEFDSYAEANEAYTSIITHEKQVVSVFDNLGISASKTTAIRLYQVN